MNRLEIGAFSEGTTLIEDIGDNLVWALDDLCLSRYHRQLVNEWKREAGRDYPDYGLLNDILDDLYDAAESYLPAYTYIGAAEGDGACYGVWPAIESLDIDVELGYVAKVDNFQDGKETKKEFVAVVSDHGNVTLYRRLGNGHYREEWSVV